MSGGSLRGVRKSPYKVPLRRGPVVSLEPHPGACSLDDLRCYARTLKRPLAVDLFCGAGGLSLGLQQAGFDVILGVDTFPQAIETHRAYFPGASLVGDLTDEALRSQIAGVLSDLEVSLVAGGPPCQPFSSAGRSKIRSLGTQEAARNADRKELWRPFVDIVSRVRPSAVLVENVPDFAMGGDSGGFREFVSALELAGYSVDGRILRAWRFGVPQYRQRLIVVGVKQGLSFHWPNPTRSEGRPLRDAISDLPRVEAGSRKSKLHYEGPDHSFQRTFRVGMPAIARGHVYDHVARAVRPDDLEAFRHMRQGSLYSELPSHLRRYRSDIFGDKYHRLHWDKPCRTITAHLARDGYWYIHPEEQRTLTIREAARAQTFPDRVRFAGHPSHAYRQIGEAVPPLLAMRLGKALARAVEKKQPPHRMRASSNQLGMRLSSWYSNLAEADLVAPWRRTESPWQVLLGTLLIGRSRANGSLWPAVRERWPEPTAFRADRARVAELDRLQRSSRLRSLDALAVALSAPRGHGASAESVPGISRDRLELAKAVAGCSSCRPVSAGTGRVAERLLKRSAKGSKSRAQLLISLAVGPDRDGASYAGLLELAETVCLPTKPICEQCCMTDLCETALHSPSKSSLSAPQGQADLTSSA